MNTGAVTPLDARASAAATNRVAATAGRARPLTGAALRNAPEAVQRTEVATQFEAILLRQLLAPTMTSMLGTESGPAASVYGDMLTDTLAQQMSRGGGFGLAQILAQQLAPRAHPANPANPKPL